MKKFKSSQIFKIPYNVTKGQIFSAMRKGFTIEYSRTDFLRHVFDGFFIRGRTSEYIYFVDNEKSYFIKTKIFRGNGATKEKLLKWKTKNMGEE